MTRKDSLRYDTLVIGQAALLASAFKQNVEGLRETLEALGVTDPVHLDSVRESQTYKDYVGETDGRGLTYDEGVYESIKDCLRPIYGF
jgi:hypothetical protein